MCSLLRELNVLLSTKYGLNTTDMANNKISYVRVTQTKSDRSFRRLPRVTSMTTKARGQTAPVVVLHTTYPLCIPPPAKLVLGM